MIKNENELCFLIILCVTHSVIINTNFKFAERELNFRKKVNLDYREECFFG